MLRLAPGLATLVLAWAGPLPALARESFAAHMALHIALVAIAAPLLAWGVAGTRADPVGKHPAWFTPIPASMAELVVVWGWHAPVLHHAARTGGGPFALEQVMFLASGVWLWLAAIGGWRHRQGWRAPAGAVALVFTSIHMTLLGALFAVAPRALYVHAGAEQGLRALQDQQLGGAIMLLVGGASYLAGGLVLIARVLGAGSDSPTSTSPEFPNGDRTGILHVRDTSRAHQNRTVRARE